MSDSMLKYQQKLIAEECIMNFINYIESISDEPLTEKDRKWIFDKGIEVFESYYVDNSVQITLANEKSRKELDNYFNKVQECVGRMFTHIMLVEFKLYLLLEKSIN